MSSNSPYYWAEFMYAVDAHDFYTNEMEYQPPETEIFPTEPIYTFKLADALDRLVAITGIPRAFEPYRIHDRPGHIRLWIAQAYAFGHVFMAPVKMWTMRAAGEPDRWYYSKPGDYEPLYHFVREAPELFDGYESVASVALIFSNLAVRQYLGDQLSSGHLGGQNRTAPQTDLAKACIALAKANLPYRLIIAGDDWVQDDLLQADLSGCRAVVRFEPSHLTAAQEAKLQGCGERLVTWTNAADLLDRVGADIQVSGAANVTVLPRRKPNAPDSPLICHLLNSHYDPKTDRYATLRNITVTIAEDMLGRTFSAAALYSPDHDPQAVDCRITESGSAAVIPKLGMWAVLKLE